MINIIVDDARISNVMLDHVIQTYTSCAMFKTEQYVGVDLYVSESDYISTSEKS